MICLLPHCTYLSETSRMLELHRALTELGVQVRVATHGGPHERLLAEAGIAYDVLGPGLSAARSAAFVGIGDRAGRSAAEHVRRRRDPRPMSRPKPSTSAPTTSPSPSPDSR